MTAEPPPAAHNTEIEQAILGALLVNNQAFQNINGLRADHFFEPVHRLIFEGAQTLVAAGKQANPLTLRAILPNDIKLAGVTAPQYLARLAAEATSVVNAKDYAESLRALSQIREMQAILEDVGRGNQFPDLAVREAFHRLDTLRLDQSHQQAAETAGQSSERFVTWMSGVMSGDVAEIGVSTGLTALDNQIGGLKGGDLIIVAGRPGMGKTVLGGGVACAVARQARDRGGEFGAGMFSMEMSENQLMARFHCDEAFGDGSVADAITYNQALNPKRFLTMPQGERLMEAGRRFANLPLMVDFSSSLTVGEIQAKARGMALSLERKFGKKLGLLVVDYINFVQAGNRYAGNRVNEVGEISRGMKQLAKDLNVPVVLLSQLSREVEKREDKIPILADLRMSGDIEQDADVVVFLYREAYYLQNNPKTFADPHLQARLQECSHNLLLVVAKNRHGPTGNVDAFCHMGSSSIRNLARQEEATML